MKKLLWLALLLPLTLSADPDKESFANCAAGGPSQDCHHINEADNRFNALENAPGPFEPFLAKLSAEDSVGTTFNSFIVASGPEDVKTSFDIWLRQSDGTFAVVNINDALGGHWGTGNLRYSGTGCTGTAYYISAWASSSLGSAEVSIVISASVGFDGIPYTFNIGPLFSATVASNVVPGHPTSAPVCNDFSPFVQTGLRLAIPVQGLPAVVLPPSVATIQLGP